MDIHVKNVSTGVGVGTKSQWIYYFVKDKIDLESHLEYNIAFKRHSIRYIDSKYGVSHIKFMLLGFMQQSPIELRASHRKNPLL